MKRFAILLVLAALVAAAPSSSAVRARVWLVTASPVRVSGSGFGAGERVTVTITAGKVKLRKAVSATAGGKIAAAWNGSIVGGCHSTMIVARGSSGRTALWREVANDCGPPVGRL
ncbi:MAG TPA: hypothetical protein VFU51_14210 [Gaiellaceae bacterium]|nr:hypothetical protein [Gaiellaceae bacterium]